MPDDIAPVPLELLVPGPFRGSLAPPVSTRNQELPYGEITWQEFEGLCARLLAKDSELKGVRRFGEQGNEQGGIDIFAFRPTTGRFSVCQCKNVRSFGPSAIRCAAEAYAEGEWPDRSDRFILALRDKVNTSDRGEAIAQSTLRLHTLGIEFEVWDGCGPDARLKEYPDLVSDYFGEPWAESFCGREALRLSRQRNTHPPLPQPADTGPTGVAVQGTTIGGNLAGYLRRFVELIERADATEHVEAFVSLTSYTPEQLCTPPMVEEFYSRLSTFTHEERLAIDYLLLLRPDTDPAIIQDYLDQLAVFAAKVSLVYANDRLSDDLMRPNVVLFNRRKVAFTHERNQERVFSGATEWSDPAAFDRHERQFRSLSMVSFPVRTRPNRPHLLTKAYS